MSRIKTAVLLAAGRGSRLRPYTDTIPKPLLPYKALPTLDYTLNSLQLAGVSRVCLVTHHLAEQVDAYALTTAQRLNLDIVCVRQQALAGTADALLAAYKALPAWFDDAFYLAATDYIVPPHFYPDLQDFHFEQKKSITMSLKKLTDNELSMRSSVRFDEQGAILEVVEKPEAGKAPSHISANLVFILPPTIMPYVHAVLPSPRGEREIQSAVNAYLPIHGPAAGLLQAIPLEWLGPQDIDA